MFEVRRTNKSKVIYDSEGGRITFDEITGGSHTLYTADVHNMVHREIPVQQIFRLFGPRVVLKAEFIADKNRCRLSVIEGEAYFHEGVGEGHHCKIVTYGDMKTTMDSCYTGECVDAVLCASYKDAGELTLAPYVYDWKSLTMVPKIIRALMVGLILAVVVFAVKDTPIKDYLFLVFMLMKDNIVPLVSSSLFM